MSGRCRACDNVLGESEIIWIPDKGKLEDLCLKCRGIVTQSMNQFGDSDLVPSTVIHTDDIFNSEYIHDEYTDEEY